MCALLVLPCRGAIQVLQLEGAVKVSTTKGRSWEAATKSVIQKAPVSFRTDPNSFIDLAFPGGERVRLLPGSEVEVQKVAVEKSPPGDIIEIQLDLKKGSLISLVGRMTAASKFEVKMSTGVSGLRGQAATKFFASGTVMCDSGTAVVVYVDGTLRPPSTVTGGHMVSPPNSDTLEPKLIPREEQKELSRQIDSLREMAPPPKAAP